MLQQRKSNDYVLATGESHSIDDFVVEACKVAGISKNKIKSSKENFRPLDVNFLKGDYSKAKKILGWKPKTKFKDLVKIMVDEDISRWERWLKGEYFFWDAVTSGDDSQIITKKRKTPNN